MQVKSQVHVSLVVDLEIEEVHVVEVIHHQKKKKKMLLHHNLQMKITVMSQSERKQQQQKQKLVEDLDVEKNQKIQNQKKMYLNLKVSKAR